MAKAIIIGATSGIGRMLATLLADSDYQVGIAGRRIDMLEDLAAKKPQNFVYIQLDVTDTRACASQLETLWQRLGGADLFVFCAGTGDINEDLLFNTERETIRTNVDGFTCCVDWVFHKFSAQGHGHLVAITSVAALRGNRQAPAYNASKAYQANYLEGIRQKAVHDHLNLYVTEIRPGFVETAMAKGEGKFWVMPVETTARQIFSAMKAKKRMGYVTRRWYLIAWLFRLIPAWLYEKL